MVNNYEWLGLHGRVAVVTGAGGGIGAQMARAFSDAGAALALLDSAQAAIDELAGQLRAQGRKAVALACDVGDPQAVAAAAAGVHESLGPCAVLLNTAGVLRPGSLIDLALQDWQSMLAVNLGGYFLCAQAFGRQMKQAGRGSMVHVASTAGWLPQPHSGAYSVTKAGVRMMSQLFAAELGEFGIRSNVVSPGMVRTPMSETFYRDGDLLARRERIVPMRRIGIPTDVAETALFLASDRAGYVTGQDLVVDGGVMTALAALIPRPGYEGAKA